MKHIAEFLINSESAHNIFDAILPEQDEMMNLRSKTECSLISDTTLKINISASDISALRATLNMWLRLLQVAAEMNEISSEFRNSKLNI